jgi:hypothetical protein
VSVDGKQIGGTFTTTAVAWEGQSQEFDLLGNWGGGGHTVAVNYLNDAAALNAAGQGIDSQDRNLFVESLSYDGAAGQGAPWELASNGTQTFKVLGASSTPVTTSGNSFITPGNGSFSDTAGNVYTLTSNDVAMENNAAIPGGAGTGKMEYYSQQVYGQDAKSGNWYIWNQSYWTGATAPAAVTVPTPVTTGSGSDSIVLQISEDTFANGDGTSDAQGDATFTVSIDGKQQGGVFTSSALHGHGQEQAFTFNGTFGGGSHTVTVNFLNDAWNANAPAGNGSVDRNLYVDQVSYDGMNTNQSSALMSSGTQNFTVGTVMPTSPGTSSAQPGQWTISSVNGMQYMVLLPDDYSSSIKYATTLYLHQLDNGSYGPQNLQNQINAWFNTASFRSSYPSIIVAPLLDQTIDPSGNTINFGGVSTSDTTGENNAIAALQQVLSQYSTDPSRVYVTGNSMGGIGSDDMIIKYNAYTGTEGKIFAAALSLAGADYGQGYPQPNQSVVQGLKGVPVWAIHGGQDTQVPLAWDQNLYAAEQSIGGVMKYTQDDGLGHDVWDTYYAQTGAASPLDWLYSQHLPSISLTTASGQSQIITAAVAGTKAFNGDTFSITAPGAAKATLGSAAETLRFISMKSVALNEGSGNVTVTSDGGTNSWTAGVGQLEVRGGSGTDSYLYHANAGRLTVDDFATAKGDTLTVDAALKGSLKVASDGHGGTMLSFGSGGGIDLKGFTGTATNLIHWT